MTEQAPTLWVALILLVGCQAAGPPQITGAQSATGLAYDLVGEGQPIVLIHGTNVDRRLWNSDMPWLQARARMLRYDLRGHGGSAVPTESYSNHDDLLGLMDELEISEASLIGLSAGAQVALDVALAVPERVEHLILVSPSLTGYVTQFPPPFFTDLRIALQADDYEQANEVLLGSALMAAPEEHADLVRTMVEENVQMWTIPPSLLQAQSPLAIRRLEDVRAETLILVGDQDLEAIRTQARLLAQRMPNARLVTVPGGEHLLNLSAPEAFRDAVGEFLELRAN